MMFLFSVLGFLVPLLGAFWALKRACLDAARQDLYEARSSVYARIAKGEFSMDDEPVKEFVKHIHAVIDTLENWDLVQTIVKIVRFPANGQPWYARKNPLSWADDVRLQNEVKEVFGATIVGLFFVSGIVRMLFVFGIPFAVIKGGWTAFERSVAGYFSVITAKKNSSTLVPA